MDNVNSVNSYSAVLPPSPMVFLVFTYNLHSGQESGQLRGRDHQLGDVLARLLLHSIVSVDIIHGNKDNINSLHTLCFKVTLDLETKDHILIFWSVFYDTFLNSYKKFQVY